MHGQATFVEQYAAPFHAPYAGQNSLASEPGPRDLRLRSLVGFRPWQGAEIWIDPEIDQGFGLSGTFGVAGFPSGEAYKVGQTIPMRVFRAHSCARPSISAAKARRSTPASTSSRGTQTTDRLVITVGKFGVVDIFDNNKYAHDPRNDFLNWAMVDTGTFDYAADAWGFTYGGAAEWYQGDWTLRGGVFDLSIVPNSTELDPTFGQFQWVGEIERRHELWGQPGKIAVTGFLAPRPHGQFRGRDRAAAATGEPADTAAVRRYTSRAGISAQSGAADHRTARPVRARRLRRRRHRAL